MHRRFLTKRTSAFIGVALLLALLLWWGHGRARAQFIADYGVYHDAAKIQENAAYVPGAATNPLRQQLNDILSRVLQSQTSASVRLSLSQEGLALINDANTQVDAMGNAAVPVREALLLIEGHASNPLYIYERGDILALVAQGKKELSAIEDIRGLSYRANFQTAEIFRRIIADHGALTSAYTLELNSDIPLVEEQFNKRENLYTQLEASSNTIARQFTHIQERL